MGWLFGTIFMGGFHLWILRVSAFGPFAGVFLIWLAFALYQGLFYGAATALTHHFKTKGIPIWVSLPLLWTWAEYLRHLGIIGNSSGAFGYSLTPYPTLVIHAQSIWVWGLSGLIIFINTLLFIGLQTRDKRPILITLAIFAILFAAGQSRLENTSDQLPISAALIQGNHPQAYKKNHKNFTTIRNTYLQLTEDLPTTNPTLIVWPETITAQLNLRKRSFRRQLIRWSKENPQHSLLFGTPIKENGHYYNAVAKVENGKLDPQSYRKELLMPFGEYFPAKPFFRAIGLKNILTGAVYQFGHNPSPLTVQNNELTVGVAICLEAIYPHHFAKTNADIYTVHANNAWFFDSSTSEKLLQMSQLRAIETGKPVLHIANTGVSAIIPPTGQPLQYSKLNTRKTLLVQREAH